MHEQVEVGGCFGAVGRPRRRSPRGVGRTRRSPLVRSGMSATQRPSSRRRTRAPEGEHVLDRPLSSSEAEGVEVSGVVARVPVVVDALDVSLDPRACPAAAGHLGTARSRSKARMASSMGAAMGPADSASRPRETRRKRSIWVRRRWADEAEGVGGIGLVGDFYKRNEVLRSGWSRGPQAGPELAHAVDASRP